MTGKEGGRKKARVLFWVNYFCDFDFFYVCWAELRCAFSYICVLVCITRVIPYIAVVEPQILRLSARDRRVYMQVESEKVRSGEKE